MHSHMHTHTGGELAALGFTVHVHVSFHVPKSFFFPPPTPTPPLSNLEF
jgi:hypothetical protein